MDERESSTHGMLHNTVSMCLFVKSHKGPLTIPVLLNILIPWLEGFHCPEKNKKSLVFRLDRYWTLLVPYSPLMWSWFVIVTVSAVIKYHVTPAAYSPLMWSWFVIVTVSAVIKYHVAPVAYSPLMWSWFVIVTVSAVIMYHVAPVAGC